MGYSGASGYHSPQSKCNFIRVTVRGHTVRDCTVLSNGLRPRLGYLDGHTPRYSPWDLSQRYMFEKCPIKISLQVPPFWPVGHV